MSTSQILLPRDIVFKARVTLVAGERGRGMHRHSPTKTVLRESLATIATREEAWKLPPAPTRTVTLDSTKLNIWASTNSIARHYGIRASTGEPCTKLAWSSMLGTMLLRGEGIDTRHTMSGCNFGKRRAVVISNKVFARKAAGKWLVKDRATFWGGFDYTLIGPFDTVEGAQKEAARLNSCARHWNNECNGHSFTVHAGGDTKIFS